MTTDHAAKMRIRRHIGKRCLQISLQTRMLTAPSRPGSQAAAPMLQPSVMHKLDNTIKAAALKAADQERSA
jgi:hypothetical protein